MAVISDTCKNVFQAYPYLAEELFYKWNPAFEGNCEGLWADYWYCIANYSWLVFSRNLVNCHLKHIWLPTTCEGFPFVVKKLSALNCISTALLLTIL